MRLNGNVCVHILTLPNRAFQCLSTTTWRIQESALAPCTHRHTTISELLKARTFNICNNVDGTENNEAAVKLLSLVFICQHRLCAENKIKSVIPSTQDASPSLTVCFLSFSHSHCSQFLFSSPEADLLKAALCFQVVILLQYYYSLQQSIFYFCLLKIHKIQFLGSVRSVAQKPVV